MEKHDSIHILKLREWPTTQHQHAIFWDMFSRSAQLSNNSVYIKICMSIYFWSPKIAKNTCLCCSLNPTSRCTTEASDSCSLVQVIFWHHRSSLQCSVHICSSIFDCGLFPSSFMLCSSTQLPLASTHQMPIFLRSFHTFWFEHGLFWISKHSYFMTSALCMPLKISIHMAIPSPLGHCSWFFFWVPGHIPHPIIWALQVL